MLTIGFFLSTRMLYNRIDEIESEVKVYDLIGRTLERINAGFWKLRTVFGENGKYDFSLHEKIMNRFNEIGELLGKVKIEKTLNKEMIEQFGYLKIYLRQYKNRTEELRKIKEELDFMDTNLESIYSSATSYILFVKPSIPLELFHTLGRAYVGYRITRNRENFLAFDNAIDVVLREIAEKKDMVILKEDLKSLKNTLRGDFLTFQRIRGVKFQLSYITSRFKKFLSLLENDAENVILVTMQNLSRKRQGIMFTYLVFMVIMISIFISYILLFLRKVLRSIGDLSKVVKSVESGDLSVRFSSSSHDEISQFGFAFNKMLEKIEKMTQRLKAEKEKVKRTDIIKGKFIKMISHELRTPLNGIIGFSEVLSGTDLSETQREYLNIIKTQSEKLKDILDMMLEFSLLERGMSDEIVEKFSLIATIEDAIDKNTKKAKAKGLSLRFISKVDVPEVLIGNPYAIFKIFDALLDNAIKFTEQGFIEIGITEKKIEEDEYIFYFYVKDTGIGIPDNKKEEIFESFFQVEPVLTRKYPGIGIGLAIVKRLIENMEGHIWVESTPGEGTTFYFTLKFKIPQKVAHL